MDLNGVVDNYKQIDEKYDLNYASKANANSPDYRILYANWSGTEEVLCVELVHLK